MVRCLHSALVSKVSWAWETKRRDRLVPTLLRGELENKPVLQVAAGGGHTLFVTADGLVFACGSNHFGQLGVGDSEGRLVPTCTLVTGQLQGKTVAYAAAGSFHTLCITADGSLFAWGDNKTGQLGVKDTKDRRVPTLVTGLQGKQVAHVAASFCHTICTTADDSVFTWGEGDCGKLGLGHESNTGSRRAAAGDDHSVCVAQDGSVCIWGKSSTTSIPSLPVLLQALDMNAM